MPYKRKGSRTWIGEVRMKGFPTKRKSFKTKREAREWEVRLKRQLMDPGREPETPTDSLLDWATWYLQYSERFTRKVFSEKKMELQRFLNHRLFSPEMPVTNLRMAAVLAYCDEHYKKRGGKVVNTKIIKNLGAAYNLGMKYRQYPAPNPFMQIEKYPEEEVVPHYAPPEADFRKVYEHAEGQDKVMLATYLHTGARRSEVLRMKWSDVNFELGTVALKTRKTRGGSMRTKYVPLTEQLAGILREHQQSSACEYVFTQQHGRHKGKPYTLEYREFPKQLCKEVGVKPFGCHGIRRLTGTILAKNGVPMKTIQEILRHQTLSQTERYLEFTGHARDAMGVLSQAM